MPNRQLTRSKRHRNLLDLHLGIVQVLCGKLELILLFQGAGDVSLLRHLPAAINPDVVTVMRVVPIGVLEAGRGLGQYSCGGDRGKYRLPSLGRIRWPFWR